jgi:hypothetical protein
MKSRPIESFYAKVDARRGAVSLHSLMSRDSDSISPGQWRLAEDLLDRVYLSLIDGKHYAVADYLKETA